MEIDDQVLRELRSRHRRAEVCRQELTRLAIDCCRILHQPYDHSDESDLCKSIIDHGVQPEVVVQRLRVMTAIDAANRMDLASPVSDPTDE